MITFLTWQTFLTGFIIGAFFSGVVVAIYMGCQMLKLEEQYRIYINEKLEQLNNMFFSKGNNND